MKLEDMVFKMLNLDFVGLNFSKERLDILIIMGNLFSDLDRSLMDYFLDRLGDDWLR